MSKTLLLSTSLMEQFFKLPIIVHERNFNTRYRLNRTSLEANSSLALRTQATTFFGDDGFHVFDRRLLALVLGVGRRELRAESKTAFEDVLGGSFTGFGFPSEPVSHRPFICLIELESSPIVGIPRTSDNNIPTPPRDDISPQILPKITNRPSKLDPRRLENDSLPSYREDVLILHPTQVPRAESCADDDGGGRLAVGVCTLCELRDVLDSVLLCAPAEGAEPLEQVEQVDGHVDRECVEGYAGCCSRVQLVL